jgi:type IV secretion system protein VirB8
MQVSNPQSPLVVYPRGTVIEARVKSISPVGKDVALVRFDTIRTDASGQAQPPTPWIAVIGYRYSGEPFALEDRFVNPLGFQVVSYRRDPETLPRPIVGETPDPTIPSSTIPVPATHQGNVAASATAAGTG